MPPVNELTIEHEYVRTFKFFERNGHTNFDQMQKQYLGKSANVFLPKTNEQMPPIAVDQTALVVARWR